MRRSIAQPEHVIAILENRSERITERSIVGDGLRIALEIGRAGVISRRAVPAASPPSWVQVRRRPDRYPQGGETGPSEVGRTEATSQGRRCDERAGGTCPAIGDPFEQDVKHVVSRERRLLGASTALMSALAVEFVLAVG